jgi:hypothetical protein
MHYKSMKETAEQLGVTYSALQSAVFHKKIAEPETRIGPHKVFNSDEIEAARKYFEQNRKKRSSKC